MFRKLTEEDFAVLREPFESGRQSPNIIGASLFGIVLFQSLCLYIEYDLAESSNYPNIDKVFDIHLGISITLLLGCLIYAIPLIYLRSQGIQYIITILASQNLFAASFVLMALFTLGQANNISIESLQHFTNVILIIGILIFIATFIRLYSLLMKGKYRRGSELDELRGKLEVNIKRNLPTILIASVGLGFIIQFLLRNINSIDFEIIFLIILSILIFFTMMFVLPEQLVILYCKYRFKSFNFDRDGNLYSDYESIDGHVNKRF